MANFCYYEEQYGNEYALLNTDVYFPLFQTLMPIETPLSAINNLQLGIFTGHGKRNLAEAAGKKLH